MTDREKLLELVAIGGFFSRSADAEKCVDYLIANGVTFHVHKTKNSMCLYCNNSMSADAPDGSEVLVCFNCAGYEGKEMIVGDDECCTNYNGCD